MESNKNSLLYNFDVNDSLNLLFLLYNEVLFFYDGEKWGTIFINDINLPDTDFRFLKKPALIEIAAQKDSTKTFLVTGGFIPSSKSFMKTIYCLNIKKTTQFDEILKKEIILYDCLLDFKFGDMKTSKFLHNAVNIDDKFCIVIGGKNDKGWLNSCEYLNLSSGEWKEFPSMNNARANFDSLLYQKNNKKIIYVYGGYSEVGKFADSLIEFCSIDTQNLNNSKWQNIKLIYDNKLSLPKICARILRYDDNILIIGGSDGKHLLKDVFEIDHDNYEVNKVGELKSARNNFHLYSNSGDVFLVGGSCKQFFTDENDFIENYVEKFTFNLASQVESQNISVPRDIFLAAIQNLGLDDNEFNMEPGFPYYSSIMSKKF